MGKSLTEKLIVPNLRTGLDPLEVNVGRFAFFKSLFSKSGKMAKINLLAILFALPAIAWFLYSYVVRKTFDTTINYSGNLGIGHMMVENAEEMGKFINFFASIQHFAILIPLFVLAFIGLGGAFFSMRKFAQGDERVTKNFLKGIKLSFADFFLHGVLAGVAVFIFAISFSVFDAYGVHTAWKVFGIILSLIILVAVVCYLVYACTSSAFYKTGLPTIIRNSALLSIKLPLQSVLISAAGMLPIVVLYFCLPSIFYSSANPILMLINSFGVAFFFFLGISFIVAAWTVYADFIYEIGFAASLAKSKGKA